RTDILLLLGDLDDLDRLEGPQMEVQARHRDLVLRLAEAKLDTTLVGLHRVDGLDHQEGHDGEEDDDDRATVEASGNDPPKAILAFADDIFEIGRTAATAAATTALGTVLTATPRTLIVSTAAAPRAAAAILIAPGHQDLFVCHSHRMEATLPRLICPL